MKVWRLVSGGSRRTVGQAVGGRRTLKGYAWHRGWRKPDHLIRPN